MTDAPGALALALVSLLVRDEREAVALFEDLHGNPWDLIEPAAPAA